MVRAVVRCHWWKPVVDAQTVSIMLLHLSLSIIAQIILWMRMSILASGKLWQVSVGLLSLTWTETEANRTVRVYCPFWRSIFISRLRVV